MDRLVKIQRQILILITKSYRSVSSESLTIIANVLPIELEIRLRNDIWAINLGINTSAVIPEITKAEVPRRNEELQTYRLRVDFSETGGEGDYTIFTDGSKTEGNVGSGMVVYHDRTEIFASSIKLHHHCTVFQAEIQGIQMALDWIKKNRRPGHTYAINVDSQAALKAIATSKSTNPSVIQIRTETHNLLPKNKVKFHWVRGHTGNCGNERADFLAKIVSKNHKVLHYDKLPLSFCKRQLQDHYKKLWNQLYITSPKASHTKHFFPNVFCRQQTNIHPNFILTQFLTSHGKFQQYLHKIGKSNSPLCICKEDQQTAVHLLIRCRTQDSNRPPFLKNANVNLREVITHPRTITFIQELYKFLTEQ